MSAAGSDVGELEIDFVGEVHVLRSDDVLTFGRNGDIVVDDNAYLHRHVGRFFSRAGMWWIANIGANIDLNVIDSDGPSRAKVAPGTELAIPFGAFLVRFEAGSLKYELEGTCRRVSKDESSMTVDELDGTVTLDFGVAVLNEEQRLLLTSLAEQILRNPHQTFSSLPANQEVASALGWTITKFNRKLDYLCRKFDGLGVPGLAGDMSGSAQQRRQRLVTHVLRAGLISERDLDALDTYRARQ